MQEFSPLRMKNMARYFAPKELDSKVILQAFKLQENKRAMSTYRAKQAAFEQRVQEQVQKMDLLKVTGKQVHSLSPERPRSKTQKPSMKGKLSFEGPIEVTQQKLSYQIGRDQFDYQLGQLKKVTMSSTPQAILLPPFEQARQAVREEDQRGRMEDYQQMILNNPALYRRVMAAYNNTKRKLEKDNMKLHLRKGSLKRETVYQGKFGHNLRSSQLPKCYSEVKKLSSMALWRQWQVAVGLSNRMLVHPPQEGQYKAYICRGNNSMLIKNLLKSRPWWSIRATNEIENSNLIWSEWRKKKVTKILPKADSQHCEEQRDEYQVNLASKKREYFMLANKKMVSMEKIATRKDHAMWKKYQSNPQTDNYLTTTHRLTDSVFSQESAKIYPSPAYIHANSPKVHKMHNHLPGCLQLNSKKLLFLNLQQHYASKKKDVFSVLPLTFLITNGTRDPQFSRFTDYYQKIAPLSKGKRRQTHNIWICKPGQNSNRGYGIDILSNYNSIRALAQQKCGGGRTLIIQKYLQNPFLYNKRKFDIRCFILVTTVNGILKGYWYSQGYLRTAVKQFHLKYLNNKFMHLTNDAIQQKSEEYGKFENHNKVTYAQFNKYLELNNYNPQNFELAQHQMKQIATELIRAVAPQLNPERKEFAFELYGLDFILDDNLRPYLIEANSNPSLDSSGIVLGRIVPTMLENLMRVAVDPVFPPPLSEAVRVKYTVPPTSLFEANRFCLVYDSCYQKEGVVSPVVLTEKDLGEQEQDQNQAQIQYDLK